MLHNFWKTIQTIYSIRVADALEYPAGKEFYVGTSALFTNKVSSGLFVDGNAVINTEKTADFPLKVVRAGIFFEVDSRLIEGIAPKRLNPDFFPKKYFLLETKKI